MKVNKSNKVYGKLIMMMYKIFACQTSATSALSWFPFSDQFQDCSLCLLLSGFV